MRKTIICLFLALLGLGGLRAEQPIFTISDQEVTTGQIIDVDFRVDDFAGIISAQFSVNWDQTVLKFRAVKNFNSGVTGMNASNFGAFPPLVDNGKLTFSWFESNINPVTIPDGSLFFTVEFEVLGAPCDESLVAITDDPTEISISEDGVTSVGLVANNGTISVPGVGCAQAIELVGNQVNGPCGAQSCVQFTVQNFVDVGTMEFSLVYDPSVLSFNEFRNFAPLLAFGEGNTNLVSPGLLRVLWFNGNVENESLADGTVLFEICFDVIGTGGQSSQVTFGNNPAPGFSDIDGNPYDVNITPASITAQCELEGFALIIEPDTICTMPNGEVCVDIQVHDFDSIIAAGFSINWDPNIFEFVRVENYGLPGLDENAFGLPGNPGVQPGQLVVLWFDLTLQGVTVPDYTSMFTLCLKAKGAVGTGTAISFTNDPLDIEVATIDSVLEFTLINGLAIIRQNCESCDFSYTITPTPPSCPRDTDGAVNLSVVEDCPETPAYLWNTGATTQNLSGVGAGVYTVTITLGSSIVIASTTVTDPVAIAVTGVVTDPVPLSAMNGSINITVTGGMAPYTYLWSTTPPVMAEDLNNIGTGVYTVTITDSKGCTFIPDPFSVGAELAAAVTNVTCPGGNNGAINLSVSFGTSPYTYNWNTTPPANTEDINNLVAGTYCVTITDALGATRDTCFNVTEPAALVMNASIVNDVDGNCGGSIDLSVSGGIMPFSYNWSNGATTQDLSNLCPGQYCVTVTYGQGCTANSCYNVALGNLGVNLVSADYNGFGVSCAGECDGQIMAQVAGGTEPISYAWSNGSILAAQDDLCAGTYTVTVTDAAGNSAIGTVTLVAPDPVVISLTPTLPSDFGASDGAIFAVVTGGEPPYAYEWFGPVTGTTAALNGIPAGTYSLVVTDGNGCTASATESLLPGNTPCYQAIKVFTPNSDGHNDFFIITCVLDAPNRLYIYNRTGAPVYETVDYQNTWIGVDNDGDPVPDGGYFWVLEVYPAPGIVQYHRGTVNLLRTAD